MLTDRSPAVLGQRKRSTVVPTLSSEWFAIPARCVFPRAIAQMGRCDQAKCERRGIHRARPICPVEESLSVGKKTPPAMRGVESRIYFRDRSWCPAILWQAINRAVDTAREQNGPMDIPRSAPSIHCIR